MLARQLEHGSPSDIYLSANQSWMDYVAERGMLREGFRADHIRNQLAVIVPKGKPRLGLADLGRDEVHRIALGDWRHVPAGMYAKEMLETMNLWGSIEHKVLAGMDARAAMAYVERDAASVGIVYKTDALISANVEIGAEIPLSAQPDIRYAVGLLAKSQHPQSESFYRYLQSKRAKEIFEKHGFVFQMQ